MLRKRITAALMAFAAGIMVFAGEGITSEAKYYNWRTFTVYDTIDEYRAHADDLVNGANNWTNQWMIGATAISLDLTDYYRPGLNETTRSESEVIMKIREKGADFFTYYDANGIIVAEDGKHYSCYSNQMLQMVLENGFLTEFMPEFKKYGLLSQIYELPAGTVEQNAPVENVWGLETVYKMYLNAGDSGILNSNMSTLFARENTTLKADCLTTSADIATVPAGTELTVLGMTDEMLGFYYVQLPDGTTGFIDAYYTSLLQ